MSNQSLAVAEDDLRRMYQPFYPAVHDIPRSVTVSDPSETLASHTGDVSNGSAAATRP